MLHLPRRWRNSHRRRQTARRNGTSQALRGGGFAYALIDGVATKTMGAVDPVTGIEQTLRTRPSGGLPGPTTSRHQIDGVTPGTMWGNGAISDTVGAPLDAGKTGVTLECGSCHDPHGNGNYRILRPIPVDSGRSQPSRLPSLLGWCAGCNAGCCQAGG